MLSILTATRQLIGFAGVALISAVPDIIDAITRARRERVESALMARLVERDWQTVCIDDVNVFTMGLIKEKRTAQFSEEDEGDE